VDALYIRFLDEPVQVTTQRLSEDVAVNYAPDGRIVGIEVLDVSEYVFGFSAVGALDKRIPLVSDGAFVLPDKAVRGYGFPPVSFGASAKNPHIRLNDIFAAEAVRRLEQAVVTAGCTPYTNGLYICNPGDVFESKQEVLMQRFLTWFMSRTRVVGMTTVPEGILLTQKKIPYAAAAMNVNYAEGMSPVVLSHERTSDVMARGGSANALRVMDSLINNL